MGIKPRGWRQWVTAIVATVVVAGLTLLILAAVLELFGAYLASERGVMG